jgi:paraquat-inducible protein B
MNLFGGDGEMFQVKDTEFPLVTPILQISGLAGLVTILRGTLTFVKMGI